jgi:hypothetical protein
MLAYEVFWIDRRALSVGFALSLTLKERFTLTFQDLR